MAVEGVTFKDTTMSVKDANMTLYISCHVVLSKGHTTQTLFLLSVVEK